MLRWEKKHDVNSAICINLTILRQVRAGSSVLIAGLKINFTRRDDSLYDFSACENIISWENFCLSKNIHQYSRILLIRKLSNERLTK